MPLLGKEGPLTLVLEGRPVADQIQREVAAEVGAIVARAGRPPGLAVLLAGDDPASRVYVGKKTQACEEAGIASRAVLLPADISEGRIAAALDELNADPGIDGILVQLPLPDGIPEQRILARVDPDKDVDGFHPLNVGRLWLDQEGFAPATPSGILELLRRHQIPLAGRRAVVVGRSVIVGKPMAALLLREHCTVTVCHSRTRDLASVCRQADILVAAVGRPALVGPDHVQEGGGGDRRGHQPGERPGGGGEPLPGRRGAAGEPGAAGLGAGGGCGLHPRRPQGRRHHPGARRGGPLDRGHAPRQHGRGCPPPPGARGGAMSRRLLVGLTGGLASGKSTVAAAMARAGCRVYDADRLVAELYQPGGEGSAAVARLFGPGMLDPRGAVDRPALAARVFADPEARRALERAIHPLVRRRFLELARSEKGIVVLEATLLVEAGQVDDFDLIVLVDADPEVRVARAVARGLSEAEARARLAAQGDGARRRAAADRVVVNDGSLEDLEAQVRRLVAEIEERLGSEQSI